MSGVKNKHARNKAKLVGDWRKIEEAKKKKKNDREKEKTVQKRNFSVKITVKYVNIYI